MGDRINKSIKKVVDGVKLLRKPAPPPKKQKEAKEKLPTVRTHAATQVRLMMDNALWTMIETRADWLALQVIIIKYDTTGVDGPSLSEERVALIKRLRELFAETTETLSDSAIEQDGLVVKELGEQIAKFYTGLPQGMFKKQLP